MQGNVVKTFHVRPEGGLTGHEERLPNVLEPALENAVAVPRFVSNNRLTLLGDGHIEMELLPY